MAAISTNATPPSNGGQTEFEVLGQPSTAARPGRINMVSGSYFPLLQIALAQGRLWTPAEDHNAARVAVVNRTLAAKYFPNGDAIGHSLRFPELKPEPPYFLLADGADSWLQIVGVVDDKLNDGLRNPVAPEIFIPYTLMERMYTQILVRSASSPLSLVHAIGLQVQSIDHDQQISGQIRDLDQ